MKDEKWALMAFCILFLALLPGFSASSAFADDVQSIHASSGDVIELSGHASPLANVTVSVSGTIPASVIDGHYGSSIMGIYIPDGSQITLTASPVMTLYASGIVTNTTFSSVRTGRVSGETCTLEVTDVPAGDYDISIYGESGASLVSLNVTASQATKSDANGLFSVNASSRGLPPGTYRVTANGIHIADVYLSERSLPAFAWITGANGQSSWTGLLSYVLLVITVIVIVLVAADVARRKLIKK